MQEKIGATRKLRSVIAAALVFACLAFVTMIFVRHGNACKVVGPNYENAALPTAEEADDKKDENSVNEEK